MKRAYTIAEVDLLEVIDTDLGPYHILLAVMIQQFATLVHGPGPRGSFNASSMTPEWKTAEVSFRRLLLRLIKGDRRVWQPSMSELLQLVDDSLKGMQLAADIRGALEHFLGEMNYPEDLLTYNAECIEPMPRKDSGNVDTGDMFDRQTDMGRFLRQVSLALRSMPFEAVCLLFSDLQVYGSSFVSPRKSPMKRTVSSGHARPRRERRMALETLLADKINALECQEAGKLSLEALDAMVSELEAAVPDMCQVHLLRHTVAMHANDHNTAVDALHRYFDYKQDNLQVPGIEHTELTQENQFPGALLNLGATHTHFGHTKQAMLALNETVRVAQQLNDDTTLQHALAQLCRLLGSTSPAAAREANEGEEGDAYFAQLYKLLRRCYKRSKELQLPHLEAYARLALAQFGWQHQMIPVEPVEHSGQGQLASGIDEVEAAVRELGLLHHRTKVAATAPKLLTDAKPRPGITPSNVADLYPAQTPVFSSDLSGYEESSVLAVEQLAATAQLLRAAAWAQAGDRLAAETSIKIFLSSYHAIASADHCCLAYAQLATSAAESQGYAVAEEVLANADAAFPYANNKQLVAARLAIAHSRAQHRGDLAQAEHLAHGIVAAAGPVDTLNADIRVEGGRRLVETRIRQDRMEEAETMARDLFAQCQEAGMRGEATRLLLTLCELHRACEAPASALPYALACRKHAQELGYDLLAAEAQVHLAELYLDLKTRELPACLRLLLAKMPLLLGNGSSAQKALLHWTLAMLHLKTWTADQLKADPQRVLGSLASAAKLYEKLEDRERAAECFYFIASVYDSTGDVERRDAAAKSWQKLTPIGDLGPAS